MEQNRKYERCSVSAPNIHRSGFAAHLGSNNHLLNNGEKVSCEICKSVLNFGPDYDMHLLTEEQNDRFAWAAPIGEKRCKNCNKDFSENIYENLLRSQIHNNNLNRFDVQWRMCEICNVEIRSTVCDKHVSSEILLIKQGRFPVQGEGKNVPSLIKLTVSCLNKDNIPVLINKPSISPYYFVPRFQAHFTLIKINLDYTGKPIKSLLTVKPFDDARIKKDDFTEITEQITQTFVWLIDQPNFNYQLGFYCHFDGDFEREYHRFRLGMKHVKNQMELEVSINEINNELQTRIENLEGQGSGLIHEKIKSMQIELYETKPILAD